MKFNRELGEYSQNKEGPLLLFIAGMHGNEPAGVVALRRVIRTLEKTRPNFKGRVVGLLGNPPALSAGKRYIDEDLNRLWPQKDIEKIQAIAPENRNNEQTQLCKLLKIIDSKLEGDHTERIVVDLHTTSAEGGMFSIITRKERNIELASALHGPVLFDLATSLSTTLNRFIDDRDLVGLAFEAGQHDDPDSILIHEAAIWVLLRKVGCLDRQESEINFNPYHQQLVTSARQLPHYVRVLYRHAITAEEGFRMYPGFNNFHEVYKGEPLGYNKEGEVYCPQTGLMLMPLYQKQGSDGFFIMEKLMESK